MKKRIVKIFTTLALVMILLCSVVFASGCYVIKGVKMNKLVGTYQLTSYSTKVDQIAEREMTLYMVIRSDGTGYYAYKDKDTALYCAEMRFRFTANQEDSSIYDYVECDFRAENDWVKFGIAKKMLNFNQIKWKPLEWGKPLEKDYDITVRMQKVSDKTDLSFICEELHADLQALPHGAATLARVYQYNGITTEAGVYLTADEIAAFGLEEPVYSYIRLDVFQNKATSYYFYESESQQFVKEYAMTLTQENGAYAILAEAEPWQATKSGASVTLYRAKEVQDGEGNTLTVRVTYTIAYELNYDLTTEIDEKLSGFSGDNGADL